MVSIRKTVEGISLYDKLRSFVYMSNLSLADPKLMHPMQLDKRSPMDGLAMQDVGLVVHPFGLATWSQVG